MSLRRKRQHEFNHRVSRRGGMRTGMSNGHIAAVDEKIESVIGQELRSLYGDVLSEPVPQRFVDLLDNLVREAEQ